MLYDIDSKGRLCVLLSMKLTSSALIFQGTGQKGFRGLRLRHLSFCSPKFCYDGDKCPFVPKKAWRWDAERCIYQLMSAFILVLSVYWLRKQKLIDFSLSKQRCDMPCLMETWKFFFTSCLRQSPDNAFVIIIITLHIICNIPVTWDFRQLQGKWMQRIWFQKF